MRTRICDLLGIEFPVIQAGMSLFTSAGLVCAVSNAGGLGSLGCWRRTAEDFKRQMAAIREGTERPFAINHVVQALDEEVFRLSLEARPALVPQVVDAVRPLPVVAAGGIADGRGFAAALMLGAEGVNVGTRFLASDEAPIGPAWKRGIVDAEAEDAVR